MNQDNTNRTLTKFENALDDIISEYLVETDITEEQINEYYGFGNNCQIAEMLKEARELNEYLKTEHKGNVKCHQS